MLAAWLHETGLVREHDCLDAIAQLENPNVPVKSGSSMGLADGASDAALVAPDRDSFHLSAIVAVPGDRPLRRSRTAGRTNRGGPNSRAPTS